MQPAVANPLRAFAGETGWLDVRRAAAYLGFSPRHLRKLVREGKVQAARPGRRYRFRVAWLDEYMLRGCDELARTAPVRRDPRVVVADGRVHFVIRPGKRVLPENS